MKVIKCKTTAGRTEILVMIIAVLMLLAVLVQSNDDDGKTNSTLQMISILFRHGDKAPSDLYPNDPHIIYDWPGGLGALSKKGSLQSYNLGKQLRERYISLLPENGLYSKNDIIVLSSYAERCIMSAQSMLAGFLPPKSNNNMFPISWQPVPVNPLQRKDDILIAQTKACAKYDYILKNLYENPPPDLAKLNEDNKDLYQMLTKYSGQNISNVLDVELLYNTLEIEKSAGLELPYWTENIYPDRMLPLTHKSYALFTETEYMKKIKGGGFLTEVINNMRTKRSGNLSPNRKIFLYAGHDVTLVNVMNSMDILNQTSQKPDYSSALAFELYSNSLDSEDYIVKMVYYPNSETKEPIQIAIPNCYDPCPLSLFRHTYKHLLIRNFDEECENKIRY